MNAYQKRLAEQIAQAQKDLAKLPKWLRDALEKDWNDYSAEVRANWQKRRGSA